MPRLGVFLATDHYASVHRRRFAELLRECLWDPPWSFRWEIGSEEDAPSYKGSALAFLRFLAENGAQFLVYGLIPDDEPVDIMSVRAVGFACGVVLNERLLEETRINDCLDESEQRAKVGDYYCAACVIGSEYRSKLIGEKKAYRRLCELRLHFAESLGAPRIWVRTHVDQHRVTEMYRKLGFVEVGYYEVEQAYGVTPRVCMLKIAQGATEKELEEIEVLTSAYGGLF